MIDLPGRFLHHERPFTREINYLVSFVIVQLMMEPHKQKEERIEWNFLCNLAVQIWVANLGLLTDLIAQDC